MAINFLNADFSAYQQLSPADFAPVIIITPVSFLIKAGGLNKPCTGIVPASI